MEFVTKVFTFLSQKQNQNNATSGNTSDPESDNKSIEGLEDYSKNSFCRASKVDNFESDHCDPNESEDTPETSVALESSDQTLDSPLNLVRSLDRWNPETCVRLLRMPSVQNYTGLKKLIMDSDKDWMVDFLEMEGLEVLLESVDRLSAKRNVQGKLEHTFLLLQCVNCFKAVVNSKNALEYITVKRNYAERFAQVLTSKNPLVKKQLFELMSTLCIYSENGHHLTLDALECYKVTTKERYRFAVLLIEIKQAEVLPHVATVLTLINCVILGACGFRFRTRIRNEFLALGLLELLESLDQLPDEEVHLQCAVFFKSQSADQEHAESLGFRSSFSHFALFQALLDKVEDTPLSTSFLIVLQNLNQLDPSDARSDYVWSILEEISEQSIANPASVFKRWMRGLENTYSTRRRSRATQTWSLGEDRRSSCSTASLRIRVNPFLNSSAAEDDEVSISSGASLDSGVPVSRTQSWTSNDIDSLHVREHQSSNREINNGDPDKETATGGQNASALLTAVAHSLTSMDKKSRSSEDASSIVSDSTSTAKSLPLSPSSPSSSTYQNEESLSLNATQDKYVDLEKSIQEHKSKKNSFWNVSLPFFRKTRKYSVAKQKTPIVKVSPPSPELNRAQRTKSSASLREGMTSIDVKRSRKQHSQLTTSFSSERKVSGVSYDDVAFSSLNSQTSDVFIEQPENVTLRRSFSLQETSNFKQDRPLSSPFPLMSSTTAPTSLTSSTSDLCLTTPLPPPPPPPPPPPSGVEIRNSPHLQLPSHRANRASWSPAPNELEAFSSNRPIYNTLPRPKSKMKRLNWAKIPNAQVNVNSIWGEINEDSKDVDVDFDQVEKLFCQNDPPSGPNNKPQQKGRQRSQVSLLESKRSLSIGIFLKQFKGGIEELVDHIKKCRHQAMGAERLRTLLRILPEPDEIKILNSFSGDKSQLGPAEDFVLKMSEIDAFEARVEGMLLLEEFPSTARVLRDHVDALLNACSELLNNKELKDFLRLVLVTGNFINSGSYAGNAVGFRLSTLPKLLETRANTPRMTLLHYLVEEAEKKSKDSLSFTTVLLQHLESCSRLTLEGLEGEVTHLSKSLTRLNSRLQQNDGDLKKHFKAFVINGSQQLSIVEKKLSEIRDLASQLAKRFCEDESKFQVEECLNILHIFCVRIKKAQSENQERKRMEENTNRKKYKDERVVRTLDHRKGPDVQMQNSQRRGSAA